MGDGGADGGGGGGAGAEPASTETSSAEAMEGETGAMEVVAMVGKKHSAILPAIATSRAANTPLKHPRSVFLKKTYKSRFHHMHA